MKKYDVCIIGAGIIGTAIAHSLNKKYKVCVLEQQPEPGLMQTSINSSVIHSGIYYTEEQNILKFCLEGKKKIKHFAEKNHITYKKCGKKILCSQEKMNLLVKRCEQYNIKYQTGENFIFLPEVFLTNYKELTNNLYYQSEYNVDYYFNVRQLEFEHNYIKTKNVDIEYEYLINVAGTSAIDIYRKFSNDYYYTLCEIEGHIHEYCAFTQDWIHSPMIYQFQDQNLPFLGPHITPTLEPGFKLGPNAIPRLFSHTHKNNLNDLLVRKKFIDNNKEFFKWNKKLKSGNFLEKECERIYGPIVDKNMWHHNKIGVRSILLKPSSDPVKDFIIERVKNTFHFLNSHSPAATCAFSIAEYIKKML